MNEVARVSIDYNSFHNLENVSVLMADSAGLQHLIDRVAIVSKNYDL